MSSGPALTVAMIRKMKESLEAGYIAHSKHELQEDTLRGCPVPGCQWTGEDLAKHGREVMATFVGPNPHSNLEKLDTFPGKDLGYVKGSEPKPPQAPPQVRPDIQQPRPNTPQGRPDLEKLGFKPEVRRVESPIADPRPNPVQKLPDTTFNPKSPFSAPKRVVEAQDDFEEFDAPGTKR